MKKSVLLLAMVMALVLDAGAASFITANFAITNTPATNATFTVNGQTFLWTNSPALTNEVQITNNAGGNATNMLVAIAGARIYGLLGLYVLNGTNLVVQGNGLTGSAAQGLSNWTVLTLTTNPSFSLAAVETPGSNYPSSTVATNAYSQVASDLNNFSTNALDENAALTRELVNLDGQQTIGGQKTFSGANVYSNAAQLMVGGTNLNVQSVFAAYPITLGPLTVDSLGQTTSLTDPAGHLIFEENNSSHLTLLRDDGNHLRILFQTGGQFYLYDGNGVPQAQMQTNGITLASTTIQPSLLGTPTNVVCLTVAGVTGQNTNILEVDSAAGGQLLAVNTNAVTFGAALESFTGNATMAQSLTVNGGLLVLGNQTNATVTGTNTINAALIETPFAVSSLVNSNAYNVDVPTGTNAVIYLTGPTGPFIVGGFAGGIDGREIKVVNPTGYIWWIDNLSGSETANPQNRVFTGYRGMRAFTNSPSVVHLRYDANLGGGSWMIEDQ